MIAAPRIESPSSKLIAPSWHTALLLALFLGLALSGAFLQQRSTSEPRMLQQHPHVLPLYVSLIVMEWGLFYFVWKGGLSRTGTKLSELIGGGWANAKEVLVDASLAVGLWAIWIIVERVMDRWLGLAHAVSIQTLLPERVALDSSVDRTVSQRGDLRRAGLSRILPETISCIHAQSVGRVVPSSHALRNFPPLSGN